LLLKGLSAKPKRQRTGETRKKFNQRFIAGGHEGKFDEKAEKKERMGERKFILLKNVGLSIDRH